MARSAVLLFLPAAVVSYDNLDPQSYHHVDVNSGSKGPTEHSKDSLKWGYAQHIMMQAHWAATRQGTEQSACLQTEGGHIKGFLRQDHSWPLGGDIACKKARTSVLFTSRSGVVGSLSVPTGILWRVETSNGGLVTNEGGVHFPGVSAEEVEEAPWQVNREGAGAIGLAGATSEEDNKVAFDAATVPNYHSLPSARPKGPLYDAKLAAVSGLTSNWEISAGQAMAVVDRVIDASHEENVHMDVAVVDAFGNLKAFARQEGSWSGSGDIAISKARTVAAFLRNSTSISNMTQPGGTLYNLEVSLGDFGISSLGGGLVLTWKGQPIGGVGVSGSTQNIDTRVAEVGLKAIVIENPLPIYEPQADTSIGMVQASLNSAVNLNAKVGIALADRGAVIKTFMAMDRGTPYNGELAMIKARTAAGTRQDTASLTTVAASTGDLATIQFSNGGLLTAPGGLLLKQSDNIYGAIAVHGSTDDVTIATAGKTGQHAYVSSEPQRPMFSPTAGLTPTNDLSLDQAQYALWKARQSSSAPFAFAVVDKAGRVKLAHRQDGATFGDLELAIRKARTSALMGRATALLAEKTQPTKELYMLEAADGMTSISGGAELRARVSGHADDGTVIGGVGVHGTTDDHSLAFSASWEGSQNRQSVRIFDIQLSFARSKAHKVLSDRTTDKDKMSVAVADERGSLKYFLRADKCPLGHAGLAREKASTAVLFDGADTAALLTNNNQLGGLTSIQGGAVLKTAPAEEPTLQVRYGGIGVSSTNGASDAADAAAAAVYAFGGAGSTGTTYTSTTEQQGSEKVETGLYGVTDVSLDQAIEVIEAALANASFYNEQVTVSVVDRYGNLKALASSDGATPASVELSLKKARTSRYFDMSTQEAAAATSQSLYMLEVSNKAEGGLSTIAGGTEFRYTDVEWPDSSGTWYNVIGAIGVAGSLSLSNDIRAMAAGAAVINSDGPGNGVIGSVFAKELGKNWAAAHYDMSLGRAQYVMLTALAAASTPVSIALHDRGGKLRGFARMTNASAASADMAIKRGRSTILFEETSLTLQTRSRTGGDLYGLEFSNGGLQTGAGGELLKAGNGEVYGSIGVAGTVPRLESFTATAGATATAGKEWGWSYKPQGYNKSGESFHIDSIGNIDLDGAMAAIEGAMEKASELGVKMNYAVVDRFGVLTAFIRDDDAWIGSIDIAIRKAKTSAAFGVKSHDLGSQSRAGQSLWRVETTNDGLISFEGGIPIRACDEVIGAIGISGSSVGNDLAVALAGAEAGSSVCHEVSAAPTRNAGAAAATAVALAVSAFL